jgi:hypothetical protein
LNSDRPWEGGVLFIERRDGAGVIQALQVGNRLLELDLLAAGHRQLRGDGVEARADAGPHRRRLIERLIDVGNRRSDGIIESGLRSGRTRSGVQGRDEILHGREHALIRARRHVERIAAGRLPAERDLSAAEGDGLTVRVGSRRYQHVIGVAHLVGVRGREIDRVGATVVERRIRHATRADDTRAGVGRGGGAERAVARLDLIERRIAVVAVGDHMRESAAGTAAGTAAASAGGKALPLA